MKNPATHSIGKVPTGIKGLDEITHGGLPRGRSTLVAGYAGSGKTVLATQFILNGIGLYDEAGVYITLEESEEDLRKNMASFGYDLREMEDAGKLGIEHIKLKHTAVIRSGHFDLSPLFIRIEEAINKVGARRLAIDTFELIFNDIQDENLFRQELVRLINWLKEKKITVVFTSEFARHPQARRSIEEFITDCVIRLKQEVSDNIYTRRLHIVKYRGSKHGTNEYPFLINESGISLLPITSSETLHVSDDVISTGIGGLDRKIDKGGFYAGSCILVSGSSGSGKTSFSVSVCMQAMHQKKRCILFSFEESAPQLKRNMASIGFDLERYEQEGLLRIVATRTTLLGIEAHLVMIYKQIEAFNPELVVFDPVTDLMQIGSKTEVRVFLLRIIDHLKSKLITILFTALTDPADVEKDMGGSSLVDNSIRLDFIRTGRTWDRSIRIIKMRGMEHSHTEYNFEIDRDGLQVKEFMDN